MAARRLFPVVLVSLILVFVQSLCDSFWLPWMLLVACVGLSWKAQRSRNPKDLKPSQKHQIRL